MKRQCKKIYGVPGANEKLGAKSSAVIFYDSYN